MIRSMTGFGKGSAICKNGRVIVEIKTVNHKYFDATLKLPTNIMAFEDKIKEILQKNIVRGKVSVNISCDGRLLKDDNFSINKDVAKIYYAQLMRLKKFLDLGGDITVNELVALPGVLNNDAGDRNVAKAWPVVKSAVDNALKHLVIDRAKEGKALSADLLSRTSKITAPI